MANASLETCLRAVKPVQSLASLLLAANQTDENRTLLRDCAGFWISNSDTVSILFEDFIGSDRGKTAPAFPAR